MLAPNGVEEERGPGYVEYAIYGGEGELPELGEIEAAAGEGLVEVVSTEVPDDWADRWQDFHRPILVGERLWLRPSWEEPREGTIDVVVDPGRAFGTGAHPTTRLCLELLLELAEAGEAEGPLTDLGTGSGLLAIAAAKLGWGPVSRLRPRAAFDRGGHCQRRRQRRRRPPSSAATSARACRRWPRRPSPISPPRSSATLPTSSKGRARRSSPLLLRRLLPRFPTLVCSGLLPAELDEIARPSPPLASSRPTAAVDGDWAALLLRRRMRGIFSAMALATYGDSGYKIGLFLHILAVVLAFGPTFGYALFFSVAPQYPRATPAILAGVQKCDRYLVNPGMIVLLLAGLYLLSRGDWDAGKAFIAVGFVAIIALFGLQHGSSSRRPGRRRSSPNAT